VRPMLKKLLAFTCLTCLTLSIGANAALTSVLGGQAYYDDQLDITWTANANINSGATWDNQVAWAAGLDIDGVTGWRLPSIDVNGDNVIVPCTTDQTACKDNEYGHLFNYGAGTVFGSGITPSTPSPFSNVQSGLYWSSTESTLPDTAWGFFFNSGFQFEGDKAIEVFAWAVHPGNVSEVPIPAAAWLFGSGLLGLVAAKRKKA
jgi:hypothetical protein